MEPAMQAEKRRKANFLGAESRHGQGAHAVCHGCGWSFPNPHPSAKQRRAHRRHCGKIDGFPLVSAHAASGSGINANDDDDDDGAAPLAASAALGAEGELSDAHSHQHTKPTSSSDAVGRPAMEEGNVGTECGMGEGTRTLGPVGFHGDEQLVGIHQANVEYSLKATLATGADKDFKVPELPYDKEIQSIDAVNVVEQLENGKQLQSPATIYAYTSNMEKDVLAVELTDDGGDSASVLTTTSPLDCLVNETCADVDQVVLDELYVESEPVIEERSIRGNNLYLKSPPIEATKGSYSMDTEVKSLNGDNFVEMKVPSSLNTTSSEVTVVPGADIAMNLNKVRSESCHMQERIAEEVGKQELGNAPVLMKVNIADHQGTSDPDKDNDVFDSDVKEMQDKFVLSACRMPQDVHENNVSDMNPEVRQCHEQVELDALPLPANHESVLKPEDHLGDPDLRAVQSESSLIDSRDGVSMINYEPCKYQGQSQPDILLENIVAEAELKSEHCTMDTGLAEMQSDSASVDPSENCVDFVLSGWVCGSNLEFLGKESENVGSKSDENENGIDGINGVEYHSVREGESGLSSGDVQGIEGSASGELIALAVTMKDRPLDDLIRVVEGPVILSYHVEENVECSSGDKVSFPDLAHQVISGLTIGDGGTCGASNVLTQVDEGKNYSCVSVTADSENDQGGAGFHHEALKEIIEPESAAGISDVKSMHCQGLGENKMKRNQEIIESVAVTNGGPQPCSPIDMGNESHGFIHLEAGIDLCADSNQKEVEWGRSIMQIEPEHGSYITEEKQHFDMDLVKNELEKKPELTHVSPVSDSCKSIIEDTSSNIESTSSMSDLNLHHKSSQNEVHKSSTESSGDVNNGSVVAERDIQIKPIETHNIVSEKSDQEGKPNQNNEVHLSHQSVKTPATEDMVTPPDMLYGIQSTDLEALHRNEEIASSICLQSDEQADVVGDKGDARCSQNGLKETMSPESASDIYVRSLHYQDLGESRVQRNYELTESVAVSNERSQSFPPIDMESENYVSIPLEAWIDYSACADSNQNEVESCQSIMQIETESRCCVAEEQNPNMDLGENDLDKEPELTHASPTSGTSRSIIDDTFSNMECMSSMSNLSLHQAISQIETNEESASDGDHGSVVSEAFFQIRPTATHNTVSEKPDEEKELNLNNEVLLNRTSVEVPTVGNMTSPSDILSAIQSSISLEELNSNGKIPPRICDQSDKCTDHLTLNQEDTAASSAQDALMDALSQMDSIEVHWGSVSALSANDAIDSMQDFDTEALPDVHTRRPGGICESSLVGKKAVSEEPCAEIADLSEPPTFTIVDGNQVPIEVGTQQSSSCTNSNGISPVHTQAICESRIRKKKEEIIAKVESWSSDKQHIPLKTLLVEANHESKQRTPNIPLHKLPLKSNRSQVPQDEGFTTGGAPALTFEHLTESSSKNEAQKEWNSPARLPTNRNDKRKVKGKPQWVPFLCCPSLN